MLTIRPEQKETFEAASRQRFLQRMVRHVKEHFPKITEKMGDPETAGTVEAAWELAKQHGFEAEYGVCQFINVVFSFGAEFVSAPWAAPILADPNEPSERSRANRLHAAALKELERQR